MQYEMAAVRVYGALVEILKMGLKRINNKSDT
uniref:Uncharacterized protein n=1 Tax=Anguilla anguilla TaxID=7936 RepID=A0A0E9TFG2_ANGAN